jgi:hypothetical protein
LSLGVGLGRLRHVAIANGKGPLEELLSDLVGSQVGQGAPDDTVHSTLPNRLHLRFYGVAVQRREVVDMDAGTGSS